jgi:hypothetical protein
MLMQRLFGAAIVISILACATAASAQAKFARGWLDVNFGVAQTAKSDLDSTFQTTISLETATFTTAYTPGTGFIYDVGGGCLISKKFGIGASLTTNTHNDSVVLGADIPHPLFFNQNAFDSATGSSSGYERSINISAVWVAVDSGKLSVRVFGGPSFVTVKQHIISDFSYNPSLVGTAFSITVDPDSAVGQDISTNLTGIHVGGDVAYFFSKTFGIGGLVRYVATGTKDITDPFALAPATIGIKGGGLHIAGGVRVRF